MTNMNDKFQVVAGSTPFIKPQKDKGKVYKESTSKEKEFYETLSSNNELAKLIPKYYGTIKQDGIEYLILEDLTYGYKKPNIMDIKLGLSHHDVDLETIYGPPSSNDPKVNFETLKRQANMSLHKELYQSWLLSKYITTPKLGFCVCGSQKYNASIGQVEKIQKEQGRTFTTITVKDKLYEFFCDGIKFRHDVIDLMTQRLALFKHFFENNPDYRFRSSSILFLYEGDSEKETKCDIRLIDFTHTKLYPPHMKLHSSKLSHYKSIDINNKTNNYSHLNNSNSNNSHEDDSNDTFFPIDGGYLFGITNLLKILDCLKNKQQPQQ